MNQRIYTLLLILFFLVLLASSCSTNDLNNQQNKTSPQYNVLFIAIDDLRPELNCYGKSHIISPNIDALANEGLVFNRAYCQYAVCNPSRTSVLTGLRPDKTKVYRNKTNFRKNNPNIVTLPQYFKQQGYITAGIGKVYHSTSLDDTASWTIPSWRARYPGVSARGYLLKENTKSKIGLGNPIEVTNFPDNRYRDGQFARRTIKMLKQLKDTTFFLAVGFEKPHLPFAVPKKYWDLYTNTPIELPALQTPPKGSFKNALKKWYELANYNGISKTEVPDSQAVQLIRGYYACTSFIDAQIGRIMNELKAQQLDKNTIVVLWGDHGWKLGDYGHWTKRSNYEVDTRSPLIISTPDMPQRGAYTDGIVELIDIYPTLCKLAGLPIPDTLDGEDFSYLLTNPEKEGKPAAMSQQVRTNFMGYTIRTDKYRYVKWISEKLNRKKVELYDLQKDPKETISVATDTTYKEIIKELDLQLEGIRNK